MTSPLDTSPRRRTLLQFLGAAAGTGAVERTYRAMAADPERAVVLEQDDRCVELTPLSGDESVEAFYDYRYPTERYEGVSGSEGYTYSSAGTTDLQRDRTSLLFLYEGPDGLSLVVVHGRLEGDDDGGVVTLTMRGMPASASWVVRDDYYLEGGQPAASNFDRWDGDGEVHELDWAYKGGRTDGGAVRGLGREFEFTVEPAFNDDAALADDHDFGPIEAWEALSGDRENPERFPLRLDRPVTVRTGGCDGAAVGSGSSTVTDDGSGSGDRDGTDDDREETKHERKQRKHAEKHRRKQRKHERKHERKQRKHERKHRRKQRKHAEKAEREQRKHERKQRKHERERRKHDGGDADD